LRREARQSFAQFRFESRLWMVALMHFCASAYLGFSQIAAFTTAIEGLPQEHLWRVFFAAGVVQLITSWTSSKRSTNGWSTDGFRQVGIRSSVFWFVMFCLSGLVAFQAGGAWRQAFIYLIFIGATSISISILVRTLEIIWELCTAAEIKQMSGLNSSAYAAGQLFSGLIPYFLVQAHYYPLVCIGLLLTLMLVSRLTMKRFADRAPSTSVGEKDSEVSLPLGRLGIVYCMLVVCSVAAARIFEFGLSLEVNRAAFSQEEIARVFGAVAVVANAVILILAIFNAQPILLRKLGFSGALLLYPMILLPFVLWWSLGGGDILVVALCVCLDSTFSTALYTPGRMAALRVFTPSWRTKLAQLESAALRPLAMLLPLMLIFWGASPRAIGLGVTLLIVVLVFLLAKMSFQVLRKRLNADKNDTDALDLFVFPLLLDFQRVSHAPGATKS
jgi:hypothetical protein